ncbi:MAG: hypothetical protein K5662_00605 [Lachnospiraceae bacterium]|nr:hypothetical protein [Lachnospiraceae bacterium]
MENMNQIRDYVKEVTNLKDRAKKRSNTLAVIVIVAAVFVIICILLYGLYRFVCPKEVDEYLDDYDDDYSDDDDDFFEDEDDEDIVLVKKEDTETDSVD